MKIINIMEQSNMKNKILKKLSELKYNKFLLINNIINFIKGLLNINNSFKKIFFVTFIFSISCSNNNSNNFINPGVKNLIVTTSDYKEGNLSLINLDNLDNLQSFNNLKSIDQDSKLNIIDNVPFILENTLNNLTKLSINSLSINIVYQENKNDVVKSSEYPHSLVKVNNNIGLLVFNKSSNLQIVNLETGKTINQIDISNFAYSKDPSSKSYKLPSADSAINFKNKIYITLQNIDYDNPYSAPLTEGKILVANLNENISENNPENLLFTELKSMSFKNPNDNLQAFTGIIVNSLGVDGASDWLVSSCTGEYTKNDGAIFAYNIEKNDYENIILESKIQKDIYSSKIISNNLGIAILSNSDFTNDLVCFNPNSKIIIKPLISNSNLSGSIVVDNNKIYIGDRTKEKPGIRIFDIGITKDCNEVRELTSKPISVGLPPNYFDIYYNN